MNMTPQTAPTTVNPMLDIIERMTYCQKKFQQLLKSGKLAQPNKYWMPQIKFVWSEDYFGKPQGIIELYSAGPGSFHKNLYASGNREDYLAVATLLAQHIPDAPKVTCSSSALWFDIGKYLPEAPKQHKLPAEPAADAPEWVSIL